MIVAFLVIVLTIFVWSGGAAEVLGWIFKWLTLRDKK